MVKKILIALCVFLITVLACFYNAVNVNTGQFQIREEVLSSQKIPEICDGMLVAYFSDLCFNSFLDEEYIRCIVDTINRFEPDIILFGGDLIDEEQDEEALAFLKEELSLLKAPYGKFAVSGDNDKEMSAQILSDAGFRNIDNSSELICFYDNSYLNITGIAPLSSADADPAAAFEGVNANYYSLALSHCPDIFDSVAGYPVNVLLSGHSLGGQIYFPLFSLFGREYGCKKYFRGKVTRNGITLDISNGLGRRNSDARFLADAEIVFYTLRHSPE